MTEDGVERIAFPDVVPRKTESETTTAHGIRFGNWYVALNTDPRSWGRDPSENFDVGHMETGMYLIEGLTFWEAVRVARAADDALPASRDDIILMGQDAWCLIEAVIGSALDDHYVFPIYDMD